MVLCVNLYSQASYEIRSPLSSSVMPTREAQIWQKCCCKVLLFKPYNLTWQIYSQSRRQVCLWSRWLILFSKPITFKSLASSLACSTLASFDCPYADRLLYLCIYMHKMNIYLKNRGIHHLLTLENMTAVNTEGFFRQVSIHVCWHHLNFPTSMEGTCFWINRMTPNLQQKWRNNSLQKFLA